MTAIDYCFAYSCVLFHFIQVYSSQDDVFCAVFMTIITVEHYFFTASYFRDFLRRKFAAF